MLVVYAPFRDARVATGNRRSSCRIFLEVARRAPGSGPPPASRGSGALVMRFLLTIPFGFSNGFVS